MKFMNFSLKNKSIYMLARTITSLLAFFHKASKCFCRLYTVPP